MKDKIEKTDDQTILLNTKNGKEAILNYETIKSIDNKSLVRVDLVTGRYHQIRVQFASRNHPLLGDHRHGKKDDYDLALFAYHLSFKHPISKEIMEFEYIPKDKIWQPFL